MRRVIVVGAGVVGLSCAVRLLEAGHRVDVVARDLPLETTASVAAAVWSPYSLPQDHVVRWARAAYDAFAALCDDDASGVVMRTGTELFRAPGGDVWWRDALVVNASGIGARLLGGDLTVAPVRGQVVVVEQVGIDHWWIDAETPSYVVPRSRDVVLGGTAIEGEWSRTPDPEVAASILARAAEIEPRLAGARILRHKVGLRPGRPSVRRERDADVIHCYGHGGCGVTVSWGCADDVVDLARD